MGVSRHVVVLENICNRGRPFLYSLSCVQLVLKLLKDAFPGPGDAWSDGGAEELAPAVDEGDDR